MSEKKAKKDEVRLEGPSLSSSASGAAAPEKVTEPAGEIFLDRGQDLPRSYGEDRITALVRDPANLFFFWELDGERSREQKNALGGERFTARRWILRVANLTREEKEDIAVYANAGDWYLSVEPECEYDAEIGILHDDGAFESFARSNRVRMPRHGLSRDTGYQTAGGGADGFAGAPGVDPTGLMPGSGPSSWVWASSSGLIRREKESE